MEENSERIVKKRSYELREREKERESAIGWLCNLVGLGQLKLRSLSADKPH